jgi:hypothetical protein
MSEEKNIQIFFVGALITSVVGAAMLFFADFGGYNEGAYNYYVHPEAQYAGAAPFFVILMGIALLVTAVFSLWGLKDPSAITENQLKLVLIISIGVCVTSALLAIILLIWFETFADEGWLDVSFFGSLIGGILTTLFFKLAQDNLKK